MPDGIIESLDHEARGVTRLAGKTVFVEGALPGETVEYASYRRKPSYEVARALRIAHVPEDRLRLAAPALQPGRGTVDDRRGGPAPPRVQIDPRRRCPVPHARVRHSA